MTTEKWKVTLEVERDPSWQDEPGDWCWSDLVDGATLMEAEKLSDAQPEPETEVRAVFEGPWDGEGTVSFGLDEKESWPCAEPESFGVYFRFGPQNLLQHVRDFPTLEQAQHYENHIGEVKVCSRCGIVMRFDLGKGEVELVPEVGDEGKCEGCDFKEE